MLGLDGFSRVRLEFVFQIEINDFPTWGHYVAHHAVPQVEDIHQQAAAKRRDFLGFLALLEN